MNKKASRELQHISSRVCYCHVLLCRMTQVERTPGGLWPNLLLKEQVAQGLVWLSSEHLHR